MVREREREFRFSCLPIEITHTTIINMKTYLCPLNVFAAPDRLFPRSRPQEKTTSTSRYHTETIVPDDAAEDVDFQRALKRLEDQAHGRGGWLMARGAFDRGDHAYMKEDEDRRRHAEEAQRDRERREFEEARARAAAEVLEKPSVAASISSSKPMQPQAQERKRPVVVKPAVRKRCRESDQHQQEQRAPEAVRHSEQAAWMPVIKKATEIGETEGRNSSLAQLLGSYGSDIDETDEGEAAALPPMHPQ
jgi:hypothetical protein